MEKWREECKTLTDDDELTKYPGCVLLGGDLASEALVLQEVRKRFCNDSLFTEKRVPLEQGVLEDKIKYSLLKEMSQLLGGQIRDQCEPVLLRIINCFCRLAGDQVEGRVCKVESPFFSVCVVMQAVEDRVAYLGWARWATDVC
jgi:hypothetical protein